MSMYPVKIKQEPNGLYTWSCSIDAVYYKDSIRPGLYACIGIAVFLLLLGGILAFPSHDLESFLIKYISADGRYKLQNGNTGLSNFDYYDRQGYEKEFEKEGIKIVYFPYTRGVSSTKITEALKAVRGWTK